MLECLLTNVPSEYHITQLRPFYHDPTEDPLKYALRDDGLANTYHVSKITNMHGEPRGSKKEIFFEVYWTGYEVPTWEPWSSMRNTSALHLYLANHSNSRVRALKPKDPRQESKGNDSETDSDH
jgi:hypothetical protein